MSYHYRKPPPVAPPWWVEWRIPLLLLWVVGGLLIKGCEAGWDYYRQRRREARGASVLEPLNAWRRRVGLAPVTAALPARGFDGDSLIHLSAARYAPARRYGPYVGSKHVRYAGEARRVLWETENVYLCPARCQAQGRPAWELKRTYTFTSLGQPVLLAEVTEGNSSRPLTRAEADSVLAYWKAQGARDSLAALASRR